MNTAVILKIEGHSHNCITNVYKMLLTQYLVTVEHKDLHLFNEIMGDICKALKPEMEKKIGVELVNDIEKNVASNCFSYMQLSESEQAEKITRVFRNLKNGQ